MESVGIASKELGDLMPNRSNPFQGLMQYIYSQLAPTGAIVKESENLEERESEQPREGDIYIEHEIAGTKIRMVVECRDHTRKNTKEWIDTLIGKYVDVQIDKI